MKYRVIRNCTHRVNGRPRYFAKGEIFETNDPVPHHFEPLGKAIEKPAGPDLDNINPAVITGQIEQALAKLDHKNNEHWTSAGLPRMEYVCEFLGREINRDELNANVPGFIRQR